MFSSNKYYIYAYFYAKRSNFASEQYYQVYHCFNIWYIPHLHVHVLNQTEIKYFLSIMNVDFHFESNPIKKNVISENINMYLFTNVVQKCILADNTEC